MNQTSLKNILFLASSFILSSVNAQQGYSSASLHWGKMTAKQKQEAAARGVDYFEYGIPKSKDIIVEEYFNYHTHQIALPENGESIALDLQWGKDYPNIDEQTAILQIGLATSELNRGSLADAPPVNVSLVIDKSGSMDSDNRLINAKKAATAFVERLRPEDHISIIAFDGSVEVLLPSSKVGDKGQALQAIDKIHLGGSTNLNAGLLQGYQQVAMAYVPKQSNKVIMLTDALTNTGVINPGQIVRNSDVFNSEYHIDISVIGVGVDFNSDLSRQITANANSSIHFINDSEDIKKVFIDEVESLLCPVGRDAKLVLDFEEGMELDQFYGYQAQIEGNHLELELNNMNRGLTQIFLARFKLESNKTPAVNARIEFFDIASNSKQTVGASGQLKKERFNQNKTSNLNEEVKKNYAIANMAQALHDMAFQVEQGQREAAVATVDEAINTTHQLFNGDYDTDVKRVYDILKTYQTDMEIALNTNSKKDK